MLRLILKALLFSFTIIEVKSLLKAPKHIRGIYSRPLSKTIKEDRQSGLLYYHRDNVGPSVNPLNAAVSWPRIEVEQKLTVFGKVSRLFSILILSLSRLFLRARTKIDAQLKSTANAMEDDWFKRGFGGSVSRTLEVWGFAISFAIKFVRHSL